MKERCGEDEEMNAITIGRHVVCVEDERAALGNYIVWGRCRGYNLLDCFSGAVQINDPLVDPHLKAVPGLGTLPTGSLAGSYAEGLGWHADGALYTEVLVLGTAYQVLAHWMR